MEGFTRLAKTTHYARGTDGYRAPELLLIEDEGGKRPHYTKKSDIWSLGCIFYELLVSTRAFTTDIAARDYSLSNTPLEIPYPSDFIHADTATPLIRAMLALDPQKRPSAKTTCSTVGGYLAKMTLPYPWTNTERTLPEFQLVVDDSLDSFGVKEFNRLVPHPLWELEQASLHVLRTLYPQVQTHEFKPFKLAEPVPLVLRNETRTFHASHQRTTRTDSRGQIHLGSELVLCTQNLSILANCGRGDDWFIEEVRGLMIFCLGHAWQWGQASRGVPNGLTQGTSLFSRSTHW
jgi:serine/threonine protein kinase